MVCIFFFFLENTFLEWSLYRSHYVVACLSLPSSFHRTLRFHWWSYHQGNRLFTAIATFSSCSLSIIIRAPGPTESSNLWIHWPEQHGSPWRFPIDLSTYLVVQSEAWAESSDRGFILEVITVVDVKNNYRHWYLTGFDKQMTVSYDVSNKRDGKTGAYLRNSTMVESKRNWR